MGAVRRGQDDRSERMFSYIRREERGPADHPLRAIRALADEVLAGLNGRFAALYSAMGRPSPQTLDTRLEITRGLRTKGRLT